MMNGMYQRCRSVGIVPSRFVSPNRSRTSQVSITGAEVPMWPTEKTRTKTPTPGWGASMMASTRAIRMIACGPRLLPLASSMAIAITAV